MPLADLSGQGGGGGIKMLSPTSGLSTFCLVGYNLSNVRNVRRNFQHVALQLQIWHCAWLNDVMMHCYINLSAPEHAEGHKVFCHIKHIYKSYVEIPSLNSDTCACLAFF